MKNIILILFTVAFLFGCADKPEPWGSGKSPEVVQGTEDYLDEQIVMEADRLSAKEELMEIITKNHNLIVTLPVASPEMDKYIFKFENNCEDGIIIIKQPLKEMEDK